MPKTVYIYCLKCPTTGDVRYIGQTNYLNRRFKEHINVSSKDKTHLGNWLRSLHGEKPVLAVLHEVAEGESWQEEEKRYICFARGMGVDLVNSTDGGEGVTMTPETCKKISESKIGDKNPMFGKPGTRLGKIHTPETRALQSIAKRGEKHYCFGKKRPPEAVAKTALKNRGQKRTPEQCAAISASGIGRKATPEARANMSAAQTGKKMPPEFGATVSARMKGVPKSPETRAAISKALTGRKLPPRSPAHCAAISAARTGVPREPFSPEWRAALSAATKGVPWSKARRAAHELRKLTKSLAK